MASDYSYHRLLPFDLEKGVKGKGTRIQVQLTDKFREAIVEMRIMPGQLLPSTRELARLFSISRATAVRVYKDLTAQGFIETIEGKGTFVRRRLVEMKEQNLHLQPIPLSDYGRHVMTMQAEKLTAHDFPELNYGCSPPEFLPLVLWRQALLQGSKGLESGDIEYGAEPFGNLGLRRALSGLLARARSIECPVENLVVCASSTYLISLLCELLVEPGQAVAFPEPGPLYARDIFSAGGCDLLPVTVDEDGPVVEEVTRLSRLPSLLYINSAHADPTGATTSLERRKALLSWAQANKVIIIEDDYDAEFRYGSTNLPPLKALCHDDSVIYLGNFWRSLYPLVNLGYAIIPQALVPVLTQCWHLRQNTFHTHLPFVDQLALTALIDSGDYEKH